MLGEFLLVKGLKLKKFPVKVKYLLDRWIKELRIRFGITWYGNEELQAELYLLNLIDE